MLVTKSSWLLFLGTHKYCSLQHVRHNHLNEALQEFGGMDSLYIVLILCFTRFNIYLSMALPASAVCRVQSFVVQSEVWHRLPSDNKICDLRREQDVCRTDTRGVLLCVKTLKHKKVKEKKNK